MNEADRTAINEITRRIIGCAYLVANALGCGFLQKVYENALAYELREAGLSVEQQKSVSVLYRGSPIGEYFADLLVNQTVVVKLKAAKALDEVHMAECLNYLKATGYRVCLLINFGVPKLQVRRIVRDF